MTKSNFCCPGEDSDDGGGRREVGEVSRRRGKVSGKHEAGLPRPFHSEEDPGLFIRLFVC